ncbi:hypothetical protein [Beijerinckia sp. L45]|uniref:hypothetical protein n=1 Tax=Beijerinckia sp. L45 TaxID=1641855 RepID=UPI00131D9ECA|nr:hypothetical protein [Beijerinckia sp. L45]
MLTQRRGGAAGERTRQSRLARWFSWNIDPFGLCVLAAAFGVVFAMALSDGKMSHMDIVSAPSTFDLNLTDFRQAFDRAAAVAAGSDNGGISTCERMPDGSDKCATSDAGFQRTAALMRASGLIDCSLRQKITFVAKAAGDGRLESIEVDGTRADRANQLRFSDVVADVATALDGRAIGSSAPLFDLRIRLMFDDSDQSINEPIFVVTPHARVECLRARSGVSLAMRCLFHPI